MYLNVIIQSGELGKERKAGLLLRKNCRRNVVVTGVTEGGKEKERTFSTPFNSLLNRDQNLNMS